MYAHKMFIAILELTPVTSNILNQNITNELSVKIKPGFTVALHCTLPDYKVFVCILLLLFDYLQTAIFRHKQW